MSATKHELDDDEPHLSDQTLSALNEFLNEKYAYETQQFCGRNMQLKEDWNLSQFWYDDVTADKIAQESIRISGLNERIACLSSPTVFTRINQLKPDIRYCKLFEYDTRFRSLYAEDFIFYDYNEIENIPSEYHKAFDVVVADPPFLSEECLRKTSMAVKLLTDSNVISCTGLVMEDIASDLLKVTDCGFRPRHKNNLSNEFACFTNFPVIFLR